MKSSEIEGLVHQVMDFVESNHAVADRGEHIPSRLHDAIAGELRFFKRSQ